MENKADLQPSSGGGPVVPEPAAMAAIAVRMRAAPVVIRWSSRPRTDWVADFVRPWRLQGY